MHSRINNETIKKSSSLRGFTIVELLIVIVVIAVLAAISIIAYNGIQGRAKSAQLQAAIENIHRKIETYHAINGKYPATQSGTLVSGSVGAMVYVDANCPVTYGTTSVTKGSVWIPGIDMALPQSSGQKARGQWGCFMYQSDEVSYILSAWNMVENGPQSSVMYRRIGFREITMPDQYYICNHVNIGGNHTGVYDVASDYYKYSYTITNLAGCSETPPAGA